MSGLRLTNVSKKYAETTVLENIHFEINEGEFVAVLGPSGCGKTTLLRLIAGFESNNSGQIEIRNQIVANDAGTLVQPEHRNIGIVFQNYALWPHMSVAENVGYALKVAGIAKTERQARIAQALDKVNLGPFAERRPADLSGGQRQRVALARCLAAGSSIVLLDEPLANLDVHLRSTMEDEFRRFHKESGATLLYITHDQSEAMALADRIAVMDKGHILQYASPITLYREPANATVATFIGNGMVLPIENVRLNGNGQASGEFLGHQVTMRCSANEQPRAEAQACVHPQDIRIKDYNADGAPVRVTNRVYRGGFWSITVSPHDAPELSIHAEVNDNADFIPEIGHLASISFSDLWCIPDAQNEQNFSQSQQKLSLTSQEQLQCV
ncbi:ABC transporter ATP-binding protein [Brucella pituitosa]|uniref:ABC transporter ATP-binding protein n=1 Tax=Brucella TaxID=234 RepID=UPI000462E9BB|nr:MULTISPECIES: ABC transporter ATP-binding protein [Brucella]MCK4205048.1 ABC transporter ATP-binding protein [Brucella pituitosa]